MPEENIPPVITEVPDSLPVFPRPTWHYIVVQLGVVAIGIILMLTSSSDGESNGWKTVGSLAMISAAGTLGSAVFVMILSAMIWRNRADATFWKKW
ncbi:MAG: hypothetical protein P8M70_13350, partial [Verrucomicrobiota bacterium]|nr:hypothetical protein [Verrucomicrobiota bacterium]